jgi:hypothetical protein
VSVSGLKNEKILLRFVFMFPAVRLLCETWGFVPVIDEAFSFWSVAPDPGARELNIATGLFIGE